MAASEPSAAVLDPPEHGRTRVRPRLPFPDGAAKHWILSSIVWLTVVDLFGPGPAANLPIAGFFTTAKFAAANPKTIAAFARAVEHGARDATNRKLVEQTIPTFTTIDKQTASLLDLPLYPTSLDAKRLQRVADLMQQFGLLSNHLDVSTMVVASPPAQ